MFIKTIKKTIDTITTHLWLSTIFSMTAGAITGFYFTTEVLRSFIPFILFLMLYPVMLGININEVKKNLFHPKLLISSVIFNFIFTPALTFVLSLVFLPESAPSIRAAFVLYSLIPCGGMVPAYTSMAKGNTNLSITIMVVNLILSIVFMPFLAKILLGTVIPVPVLLVMKHLALIIFVPWILAAFTKKVVIKKYNEAIFDRLKLNIKRLPALGVIVIQFIIFALNGKLITKDPLVLSELVAPAFLFLTLTLLCTILFCKVIKESKENTIALSFSNTAKNISISLTLAYVTFGVEIALYIAVIGAIIQFSVMMAYLSYTKKHINKSFETKMIYAKQGLAKDDSSYLRL